MLKIEQFVFVVFFLRFFKDFAKCTHCVAYLLMGVDFLATVYQLLSLLLLAMLFVYVWTKRKVK